MIPSDPVVHFQKTAEVIIDEDHDEEDAKRKREGEEKKEGGIWPFG